MELNDKITSVKGIGDKTAGLYARLGIFTVKDLIYYIPRSYISYEEPKTIKDLTPGIRQSIKATVVSAVTTRQGRKLNISEFSVKDKTGFIKIIFYNSAYIRNVFRKGMEFIFTGEVKLRGPMYVMEMPEYHSASDYSRLCSSLQPIYPLTAGLKNNALKKSINNVSFLIDGIEDYLSPEIREKYELIPENRALYNIHFPRDVDELKKSVHRLAFDEFYKFIYDIRKLKASNEKILNEHKIDENALQKTYEFIKDLPFELTEGQKNAVDDMLKDMSGDYVMKRMIQGDVGSGKTIVAASALYANALSGYQGALMVPTEVLANQHYKDFIKLFEPYGLKVALLTGSMKQSEKKAIYSDLSEGNIDIIIGTHALIQDKAIYKDLGMVCTDEQHRFGVKQRDKLSEKGAFPNTIIMSATPIPRTLAIIIYADMDISVINELPKGRKRILNSVLDTSMRPSCYRFIAGEIKKGHQAYIICPMIEESENFEAENVTDYVQAIASKFEPGTNIGCLHGKMNEADKNEILQSFTAGEIDILVSTTVIEVGINNPNATVMMIENAERFGLAQLHQLRGRVGRGDAQSYAIFVDCKNSPESKERLKVMEESNDGFYIASMDLKLRGPGELFGVRQSGDMPFKVADVLTHADALTKAQEVYLEFGDIITI